MTLCFVSDYYPAMRYFGGIAVYTRRIAIALAERGHQVHVIVAKADESSDMEDEGVHVHFRRVKWIPFFGRFLPGLGESFGVARIVTKLDRIHHFDAVEIPNWEGLGYAGTRLRNPPLIIRLHTSMAESIETAGREPTRAERFVVWLEKSSARRARAVITHSQSHCRRMSAAYGLSGVTVIPHGIELPETSTHAPGKTVLSIGGASPRKGMHVLLSAIPSIVRKIPGATLNIVGIAPDHASARACLDQCAGDAGRVHFLGSVSADALQGLYRECDLYVSPSTYESFGLTFLEAMSHGRPVIGCNISAMPEIIDNGITGLLVEPDDSAALGAAIVELLEDESRRMRMGAAAREVVSERFSSGRIVDQIEQFFQSVAGNGSLSTHVDIPCGA